MLMYKTYVSAKMNLIRIKDIELDDVYSYICQSNCAYSCLTLANFWEVIALYFGSHCHLPFNILRSKPTLINEQLSSAIHVAKEISSLI